MSAHIQPLLPRDDPRMRIAKPRERTTTAVRLARQRSAIVFLSGEPATPGHLYRVVRVAASATAAGLGNLVSLGPCPAAWIHPGTVLWVWRARLTEGVQRAIDTAHRVGAKVIFDVDDLTIDPALASQNVIDGMRTQKRRAAEVTNYFEAVRATMLQADLATASTDELAAHIRKQGKPALVIPNGFDHESMAVARQAARQRTRDGLLRIGYAAGSRTHQRDFAVCAEAVASVLRRHRQTRLVIFTSPQCGPLLDINEYPALRDLDEQVEIRPYCAPAELPLELARFDINLAPLATGNPFCEAKSELKYFEAALVDVPTIASPTGPFRRAIRHDETGLLASTPAEWGWALDRLVSDAALRVRLATAAHRDVLWPHGPEQRAQLVADAYDLAHGGRRAAMTFARVAREARQGRTPPIPLADAAVVLTTANHCRAEVTVIIPVFNYATYILEALNSVAMQTLGDLDLIVIDDGSDDASLATATTWAGKHAKRFGKLTLISHQRNAGLASARNTGFARAETPWVLPLDADNRLLPDCAAECLAAIKGSDVAYVYPTLRHFGEATGTRGESAYDPLRLIGANYIDAMALIARAAWVAAGGYRSLDRAGWEDYDLWCRLAELGLRGAHVGNQPLAEYRVHATSMSNKVDAAAGARLRAAIESEHPWLRLG